MDRRDLLTRAGALLAYPLLSERAAAQAWPSRPIRIVTGDAAGGAVDSRLREFIVPLAQELKTQIVVDNKPGAGNQISHQYMITQPADGYTV